LLLDVKPEAKTVVPLEVKPEAKTVVPLEVKPEAKTVVPLEVSPLGKSRACDKLIGPVAGRLGAKNPLATEAQILQGQLQTAAQTVGRYLEGGKLTDEDRIFYQQNLPSMNDTPEVAKGKLENLISLVERTRSSDIDVFGRAGYDVSGFSDLESPMATEKIPVDIGGESIISGSIIENERGEQAIVNPDGTLTLI
jgi:hypothetical protein